MAKATYELLQKLKEAGIAEADGTFTFDKDDNQVDISEELYGELDNAIADWLAKKGYEEHNIENRYDEYFLDVEAELATLAAERREDDDGKQ